MNMIAVSLIWCVFQVTIVCIVAISLDQIHRRAEGLAMNRISLCALIVALVLTALAFSPWPRWTFQQQQPVTVIPTTVATPEVLPDQRSEIQQTELVSDIVDAEEADWKAMLIGLWQRAKDLTASSTHLALPLLILSLTIGGSRFVFGLIAIRRITRCSDRIEEAKLNNLANELQSTLGFHRPIRLLESDQISSPATVGWRAPAVLLPRGWRDWSMEQTHAVLAHEIAHIASNDFGVLALAQLSTVFHFYHPLVHRLVGNLRLELELAADAAASSIVGGNQKYLTVLTTMALHDQPVSVNRPRTDWPARPFLPAPETLLRRIEMLQTTTLIEASVPTRGRMFAIAIILFAGVVAAGFRPVTVTAQEDAKGVKDTKDVVDEKSEDAILLAKFDKRKRSELTRAEWAEFGSLTKRMYKESPGDPGVKNRYADFLLGSNDFLKALPILLDLAKDDPVRGLQAAAITRRFHRNEEAKAIAERSLKLISTMSQQDPTNLSVSLTLAQNQLFLKRFEASIKTSDKAIKLAKSPEDRQLASQAFGDATCAFVNHLDKTSNGTIAERVRILEMLKVAVKRSPKNPPTLTTISQQLHTTRNDDNEQITELRAELRAALDEAKVNTNEKAKAKS